MRFFVGHRQKDWLEWLASVEFAVNNKVHTATKVSSFMTNYGREMRMGEDIRKRGKVEKATEFVERIKRVHEEARAALKKAQEDMKRQADKERKVSGTVHTGVEVRRMDLEMSRLVERPWLQLMCCAVYLPHSHNFR